jgi:hypothetical protein
VVNTLEFLYALTAIALVAALIQLIRHERPSARRFALAGAIGIVAALFLYWLLSSSA